MGEPPPPPGFHEGYEFDAMARRPLYQVCPRWLVQTCGVGPDSTVVDLGCGSGVLTLDLLRRFPDAPGLRIVAIDPSEWELQIFRDRIDDPRVSTLAGRAQEAGALVSDVDVVLLCNVLHQIPIVERRAVFEGVYALLRSGGWIGANTLFYDGGVPVQTRTFYTLWLLRARERLRREGVALRPPEGTPVALQQLTAGEHAGLLEACGFVDVVLEEIDTDWAVEDWEALSGYSVFIRGALAPEIDLARGREALIHGVRAAYVELGLRTVRRGWLHVAGRRP